jgi:hypothetical protein
MADSDTVSSGVYQDLIQLTFLCGRGLPLEQLMARFLEQLRPAIPADGLWLHADGALVARSADEGVADLEPPPVPKSLAIPVEQGGGVLVAFVAPGVTVACHAVAPTARRAKDVMMMLARIVGLAWRAEAVARSFEPDDDYHRAKAAFEKRWLTRLLDRTKGNVSEAARLGGLSRVYLYEMMKRYELKPRE